MATRFRTHSVLLALTLLSLPVLSQDTVPSPGQRIRLTTAEGTRFDGAFTSWSQDSVRLVHADGPMSLARAGIVRWQEPVPGSRRSRWQPGLAWGALLGTLGGTALGLAAAGTDTCEGGGWCLMADLGRGAYAIAGASMGLIVGATSGTVIGLLLHTEDWYDRPEYLRR